MCCFEVEWLEAEERADGVRDYRGNLGEYDGLVGNG